MRGPLYLYALLSYRIATLANASVVVRSNLPRLGEFDCRRLADNDPLRSPLDFILINPSARTGLTNAKSKAGDLIVEPNPILLATELSASVDYRLWSRSSVSW